MNPWAIPFTTFATSTSNSSVFEGIYVAGPSKLGVILPNPYPLRLPGRLGGLPGVPELMPLVLADPELGPGPKISVLPSPLKLLGAFDLALLPGVIAVLPEAADVEAAFSAEPSVSSHPPARALNIASGV